MQPMEIQEIARAVGCRGNFSGMVEEISTDTRTLPQGCLFVALKGERFNGHDYIVQAFEKGAAFALADERRDYGAAAGRVLYTADTKQGLMAIAAAYRKKFPIRCVGVTGSVGKTTTKDMIAQVVSAGYRTLKTEGNQNNEIGLPKTLFQLNPAYEAAVVEMGMEGLGEIAALAAVAQPQIGVITNIGVSHIERLGSRENILKAKMELADALPDGAPLILCKDNDLLSKVTSDRLRILFYSVENRDADVWAERVAEENGQTRFDICWADGNIHVQLPCAGVHNVQNALAAFLVGRQLGIPAETCAQALAGYVPSGMRQKVVQRDGYTVVEDCYNASPDSMYAALKTLENWQGGSRRIAVLADMLELGQISEQAHRDVGRFAAMHGVDLLLAYGPQARYYVEGANEVRAIGRHFTEKETLCQALRQQVSPGCVVWVKGSRGMRLEEILEGLYR